jgi:hypothetical protein
MARRVRPLADREARLALGLAGVGFVCFGATLPAAGVLGVRAIRSKRIGDGSDPAVGVLVLGISWISFMLAFPIVRSIASTASLADDHLRIVGFVSGWIALAWGAMLLANVLLRIHPERYVAIAAARSGIILIAVAGFLQTVRVTSGDQIFSAPCGTSNADCLGATPWASIVPAAALAGLWFLGSFLMSKAGAIIADSRWFQRN